MDIGKHVKSIRGIVKHQAVSKNLSLLRGMSFMMEEREAGGN